jgi:hypothetical protein
MGQADVVKKKFLPQLSGQFTTNPPSGTKSLCYLPLLSHKCNKQRAVPHHKYIYIYIYYHFYMNLHLFSSPNNACFISIQNPYPVQLEKRYVTLPITAMSLVCLATSQIQHNNSSTEYSSQSNRISVPIHSISEWVWTYIKAKSGLFECLL